MEDKETYQKKIEARIDQLSAKIKELTAKVESRQAESKAEYYQQIENLKERKQKARQQLETIKKSSTEAWQTLKGGLDDAVSDLQNAFERASEKFKK